MTRGAGCARLSPLHLPDARIASSPGRPPTTRPRSGAGTGGIPSGSTAAGSCSKPARRPNTRERPLHCAGGTAGPVVKNPHFGEGEMLLSRSFIARVALAGLAGLLFIVSSPGTDHTGGAWFSIVYADCSSGDCWPPPPPSNGGSSGGGGGGCSGCVYDSSCYSIGACINTCSDPTERQKCRVGGHWGACNFC